MQTFDTTLLITNLVVILLFLSVSIPYLISIYKKKKTIKETQRKHLVTQRNKQIRAFIRKEVRRYLEQLQK
jgi:hypothetical protein